MSDFVQMAKELENNSLRIGRAICECNSPFCGDAEKLSAIAMYIRQYAQNKSTAPDAGEHLLRMIEITLTGAQHDGVQHDK